MAYSAEIDVKVRNLGSISQLEKKLSSISRSVNAINKKRLGGGTSGGSGGGSAKSELSEEQKLLQLENKRLTIQNKGLGVESKNLDLKLKGTKLAEAANNLSQVENLTEQDNLDLAKNKILLADKEIKQTQLKLKEERGITTEVEKRAKFLKGAPTGFKADQFGPQQAPTKGAGQAAMSIDTITKQSEKRLRIELKLRELEAKGVNTANLRGKMGELVDAQNRKQFGTIKQLNREIGRGIAKEESKLKILQLQNKQRAEEIKSSAKMEAIRQGNFAKSGPGVFGPQPRKSFRERIGATRGFDTESALISGAFPLLFGQGPIGAIAGGLGGGIGGMFGTMGGFAGGIAATALVQQIQSAVSAISELGRALGPFTQNTEAVTTALGLQGSVQEERIKQIERTQGKTAAFNAAMKIMGGRITQDGVDKLKRFGENTRLLGAQFTIAITKLQAFAAGIGNFVIKILGLEKKLREAANINIVKDFAATGDTQAKDLVARREALKDFGSDVRGSRRRFISRDRKVIEDQLVADEQEFATKKKINIETQNLITKSKTLVEQKKEEDDINQRSLKLIKGGMNKELAKSIASLERQFDLDQKILEQKKAQAKEDFKSAVVKQKDEETQLNLQTIFEQTSLELENHNKLRAEGVDLTKKLFTETDKVTEAFKELSVSIGEDIKEGIKGLIKGTSTLSDLLNNVADKFLDVALNQALFGDILGSKGDKGGGLLGFLGFANGGRPPVNRPSIVGEKGPELFVPRSSGNIIPNNKLGGGNTNNVVVNVDASGSDVQGDDAAAKELGGLISVAVQGELLKQQRPGGLLSR